MSEMDLSGVFRLVADRRAWVEAELAEARHLAEETGRWVEYLHEEVVVLYKAERELERLVREL